MMRIKYLADINSRTLPEVTESDYKFYYVDIGSVDASGKVDTSGDLISFSRSPSRARRLASPGDTVVSTVRTYLRAVARVPKSSHPLVFSTGFATLRGRDFVDDRFLSYACRSENFIDEVVARSVGVSYPAVNAGEIGDVCIWLPLMKEQRRIADFLDIEASRIDALVKSRRRTKRLLLEKRSVNVFDLVSGAESNVLKKSRIPWLDQVPGSWKEVRLGLVAKMGSGHTPSRSRQDWWVDCTIPWITTGEVSQVRDDRREELTETRERISEIGLANSAAEIHPKGTVVLCRTASAGYSAVMGADMATSQDFVTWTCGPRLEPYYLLWCLRAMRSDLLGRLAMGSTHKTIYVPDLQMLRIPLPEIGEQRRIVQRIQEANKHIDQAVDSVKRQIDLLEERKRALITAAVTGQIDVTTARGADLP